MLYWLADLSSTLSVLNVFRYLTVRTGEFYCLPIFICAGLMFMASAVDFILIFVSLELVTIGFYAMVAYMRRHTQSLEAGVKYLILGALSTGFLIYGITWIFGLSGQTNLLLVKEELVRGFSTPSPVPA